MRRFALLAMVWLVAVLVTTEGCDISGQPCGLFNLNACSQQNICGVGGGAGGGDDGAGGYGGGVGGADVASTGAASSTGGGTSAATSTGAGVGGGSTGAGASAGAGAGPGARTPPRASRRRGHHKGELIGTAVEALSTNTVVYCFDPCSAQCLAYGVGASITFGFFDPSIFKFTTIIADDGEGDAGGWQESVTPLGFAIDEPPQQWTCTATIGMPLRTTSTYFKSISPTDAATLSAAFVNQVWREIRNTSPNSKPVNFCGVFKAQLKAKFAQTTPIPYYQLGARVDVTSP